MYTQYQFLQKLRKATKKPGEEVSIEILSQAWPKFPGHEVIRDLVSAIYFQTNYDEMHKPKSYILTPEGWEWVLSTATAKTSKNASVIAAVLAASGIIISVFLHFLP